MKVFQLSDREAEALYYAAGYADYYVVLERMVKDGMDRDKAREIIDRMHGTMYSFFKQMNMEE